MGNGCETNDSTERDLKRRKNLLIQFQNCRLIRDEKILSNDLWIRGNKILDPEEISVNEKLVADLQIDCDNYIIVPGLIDLKVNAALEPDLTLDSNKTKDNLKIILKNLLKHGVASYCPTLVSTEVQDYNKILPIINKTIHKEDTFGASVIGVHLKGSFLNKTKTGEHESSDQNYDDLNKGVSLGHSSSDHSHPGVLHIAYNSNPQELVLVTDSIVPIEQKTFNHLDNKNIQGAFNESTSNSITTMDVCIKNVMESTGCSIIDAVKCASENPAKLTNIYPKKGSLNYDADADFILIDDHFNVKATFIKGDLVWSNPDWSPLFKFKYIP